MTVTEDAEFADVSEHSLRPRPAPAGRQHQPAHTRHQQPHHVARGSVGRHVSVVTWQQRRSSAGILAGGWKPPH